MKISWYSDSPLMASMHMECQKLPMPLAVLSMMISVPGSSATVSRIPVAWSTALPQDGSSERWHNCFVRPRPTPTFAGEAVSTVMRERVLAKRISSLLSRFLAGASGSFVAKPPDHFEERPSRHPCHVSSATRRGHASLCTCQYQRAAT